MDNATSAAGEKRKVSPKFNAENADLLLISKDDVVFRVHRLYLEAASPIFKDMFELGKAVRPVETSAELPEVQLEESSNVLEVALPYVYPKRVEPFVLYFPQTWEVVKMFDKYEMHRGLEAVEAALSIRNRPNPLGAPVSPNIENRWLFTTFVFASHIGSSELALEALRGLLLGIDSFVPSQSYDLMSESRGAAAPARAREEAILRLEQLFATRKAQLVLAREKIGAELASRVSNLAESATTSRYQAVCTIFELWEGSAPLTCTASLVRYRNQRLSRFEEAEKLKAGGEVVPWMEAWTKLERAVDSLAMNIAV